MGGNDRRNKKRNGGIMSRSYGAKKNRNVVSTQGKSVNKSTSHYSHEDQVMSYPALGSEGLQKSGPGDSAVPMLCAHEWIRVTESVVRSVDCPINTTSRKAGGADVNSAGAGVTQDPRSETESLQQDARNSSVALRVKDSSRDGRRETWFCHLCETTEQRVVVASIPKTRGRSTQRRKRKQQTVQQTQSQSDSEQQEIVLSPSNDSPSVDVSKEIEQQAEPSLSLQYVNEMISPLDLTICEDMVEELRHEEFIERDGLRSADVSGSVLSVLSGHQNDESRDIPSAKFSASKSTMNGSTITKIAPYTLCTVQKPYAPIFEIDDVSSTNKTFSLFSNDRIREHVRIFLKSEMDMRCIKNFTSSVFGTTKRPNGLLQVYMDWSIDNWGDEETENLFRDACRVMCKAYLSANKHIPRSYSRLDGDCTEMLLSSNQAAVIIASALLRDENESGSLSFLLFDAMSVNLLRKIMIYFHQISSHPVSLVSIRRICMPEGTEGEVLDEESEVLEGTTIEKLCELDNLLSQHSSIVLSANGFKEENRKNGVDVALHCFHSNPLSLLPYILFPMNSDNIYTVQGATMHTSPGIGVGSQIVIVTPLDCMQSVKEHFQLMSRALDLCDSPEVVAIGPFHCGHQVELKNLFGVCALFAARGRRVLRYVVDDDTYDGMAHHLDKMKTQAIGSSSSHDNSFDQYSDQDCSHATNNQCDTNETVVFDDSSNDSTSVSPPQHQQTIPSTISPFRAQNTPPPLVMHEIVGETLSTTNTRRESEGDKH